MEKDELALLIRIKQKIHEPIYFLLVGVGSFCFLTIISFYVHHFFQSQEQVEWLFTAVLNLGFSVMLPWVTIEWKNKPKGKTMMALGLTIIVVFFWFYEPATMVGFLH